ncbi:MAG: hypothetical protein ACEPO2_14690 [Pelagibaca sp.]
MQTKGEYRVGINFNPSGDDLVGQIKRKAADLIDLMESIDCTPSSDAEAGEKYRLRALAQTEIESAAMWAVKAATKPPLSQK